MTQSKTPPPLGELEIQVLEHLWSSGETSAKALHEALSSERTVSVNTVQSAMERLYRKGLLSRFKSSHRYLYQAKVSKESLLGNLINDVVCRFNTDLSLSAAAILNAAESLSDEGLDLMEAEIQRRRQVRENT